MADCDNAALNSRHGGAQIWRPNDLDAFAAHVRGNDGRHALLIDCSASDEVASHYSRWLAAGLHVVTPNKLAGSGPLDRWQAIRAACAEGARFRCEATVCAGLPVVQTLRDLLDTGDELLAAEGMFSGTLAWLCNRHDGQVPFSALVREAHALGYTEPDPRDDLSGLDVARKLVILAREAGWPLSLEEVDLQSLVPAPMAALSREAFFERLDELDAPMAAALTAAREAGGVLRHVAKLDREGRASVRLQVLPASHPFAHTRLTDNVVQFRTRRYCDNPLLVQGPGAGPEVTAAGVFARPAAHRRIAGGARMNTLLRESHMAAHAPPPLQRQRHPARLFRRQRLSTTRSTRHPRQRDGRGRPQQLRAATLDLPRRSTRTAPPAARPQRRRRQHP
ncbi:hypothetical protein RLIN73S_01608 [Rhodanobacter lindaniclasticus]